MTMAIYKNGPRSSVQYVPASTVNAGDVVVVGNLPFISDIDNPVGTGLSIIQQALYVGGIYQMTADQNYYPVGTFVYWDPTAQKVTAVAGAQCVPFGWIVGLANGLASDSAASTTVFVLHDPSDDTSMIYNLGAAAADNISNTAAETAFATTAVIPAAQLVAGDVIHVRATGIVNGQNSTNTNTVKLKISTALNTFTAVLNTGAVNAAANAVFILDADLVVTAIGNTGSLYAVGDIAFGAQGTATRSVAALGATAINTNLPITIEVTDTQSAANAGNVTQLLELMVEKHRK